MSIEVRQLHSGQSANWPEDLLKAATFTALDEWSGFAQSIYKYPLYRLEAVEDGKIVGILVLVHVKHPFFGNYLATAPFGSYGGFAFSSQEARDALLEKASSLANEIKAEYAVVRFIDDGFPPPAQWRQNPIYSTYLLDLPDDPETLMKTFGSKHRKHTRQATRKGFQVQVGHLELLGSIYKVMSQSMHELGSPYHAKKYLQEMALSLGDKLEFVLVTDEGNNALAAASVLIYHEKTVTMLHANILNTFRSRYVGEFLYWSVLERCIQRGIQTCDFGRSLNGSGNQAFKEKWKTQQIPLSYWYYLPDGGPIPELNQKSAKFRFAIWAWKRLPLFVAQALGPVLIRGIV